MEGWRGELDGGGDCVRGALDDDEASEDEQLHIHGLVIASSSVMVRVQQHPVPGAGSLSRVVAFSVDGEG